MSLETMTKLSTVTVGAGGVSSISFSNIPQNYTDLLIKASPDSTYTGGYYGDGLLLTLNGDTTVTNYNYRFLYAYDTSSGSGAGNTNGIALFPDDASTMTNNAFGNIDIYIPNYAGYNIKTATVEFASEVNSANNWVTGFWCSKWNNASPITSITLTPTISYVFKQYSTFTLYGVKSMSQSMPQTVRAIGGTITRSGGYTYHTFTSSNMFIPNGNINSAEVLVIAGGGSGGGNKSGCGGAGGLVYFSGQSFTSPVSVVVGAGGSGVTSYRGASGTNSFIGSLTAAVGGGAGGGYDGTGTVAAGLTGGSGGGGAGSDSSGGQGAGGSGTTGQGNAGGAGAYITTSTAAGGGGGGAGGAGTAGSGSHLAGVGGLGGVGSSAYSAWGLATSTGQNVSSTYYYAGGGGGGTRSGVSGWTGGYGGGGNGSDGGDNTAGAANTGGGGGASGQTGSTPGASGGSGVVIIRYLG